MKGQALGAAKKRRAERLARHSSVDVIGDTIISAPLKGTKVISRGENLRGGKANIKVANPGGVEYSTTLGSAEFFPRAQYP
jgi:hypothetical protein